MEWLKASIDYGMMGLLRVMSIISIATAIERHLVFRSIKLEAFTDKKELEKAVTNYNLPPSSILHLQYLWQDNKLEAFLRN